MIRFYFHSTPNAGKIALFLEETGLPYEVVPVDTYKESNIWRHSAPSIRTEKGLSEDIAMASRGGRRGPRVTRFHA